MLGGMPLQRMWERIRMLSTFEEALHLMRAELSSYGLRIPELMQRMDDCELFSSVAKYMEEVGPMGFSEGWKCCIERNCSFLTETERHEIAGLGEVLGRYTLEEQLFSIQSVIGLLVQGKEETRNKLRSVSRLYMGTSLSLSAMLVVLLI